MARPTSCVAPDVPRAPEMIELIDRVRKDQDSIGGVSEIVASNVPAGLGEPVFDKLKADLAKALFSLPAVVGVEYGSGFASALQRGSEHNDEFFAAESPTGVRSIRTRSKPPWRYAGRHLVGYADRRARGDQAHEQPVARTTNGHRWR